MIDARSGVVVPDDFATLVDPTLLVPAPWNPNTQKDRVFKALVKNIKEVGFDQAVEVVPLDDAHSAMRAKYLSPEQLATGKLYYLIVGGHHRWEAARVLDMSVIPIVQKPAYDEDMTMFQNTRKNLLTGKIDAGKFQKLYFELLEKGYEEELLQEQMGLVEEQAMKDLLKGVKDNLPKDLAKKLGDRAGEVHTPDDLARILNELFSMYGDTLPLSFMVFTYGGKTHLWLEMDKPVQKAVDDLREWCAEHRVNINTVLGRILTNGLTLAEAREQAALEAKEDVDFAP